MTSSPSLAPELRHLGIRHRDQLGTLEARRRSVCVCTAADVIHSAVRVDDPVTCLRCLRWWQVLHQEYMSFTRSRSRRTGGPSDLIHAVHSTPKLLRTAEAVCTCYDLSLVGITCPRGKMALTEPITCMRCLCITAEWPRTSYEHAKEEAEEAE